MGTVVPILVLSYLSDPLGAVPAYLVSALVPVGWVLADLIFITGRFNFITGVLGLNAIVRGLLAFWFVDGALYALKDTVGSILMVLGSPHPRSGRCSPRLGRSRRRACALVG